MSKKDIVCPSCGRPIRVSSFKKHFAACSKLPSPDILIEENKTLSRKKLAKKYGVNEYQIQVKLGRRLDWRSAYEYVDSPTCLRCGTKYEHPQIGGTGGYCLWCLKDAHRGVWSIDLSTPTVFDLTAD